MYCTVAALGEWPETRGGRKVGGLAYALDLRGNKYDETEPRDQLSNCTRLYENTVESTSVSGLTTSKTVHPGFLMQLKS